MEEKPIKCRDISGPFKGLSLDALIPRKKKPGEEFKESNRVVPNGITMTTSAPSSDIKNKRTASEAQLSPLPKRPKIANGTNGTTADNSDLIVVEDASNGAIVIDDD